MEGTGPQKSELSTIAGGIADIPGVPPSIAAGLKIVDAIGGVIQAGDMKDFKRRKDELGRRTDAGTTAAKEGELEEQLEDERQLKTKGDVFNTAKGGKLSPMAVYQSNKANLATGGMAPMQPMANISKSQDVKFGFASQDLGVKDTTASVLDTAINALPNTIAGMSKISKMLGKGKGSPTGDLDKEFGGEGKMLRDDAPEGTTLREDPNNPGYMQSVKPGHGAGSSGTGFPAPGGTGTGTLNLGGGNAKGGKLRYETGGVIQGEGDGSMKDDKINIESNGGYVVSREGMSGLQKNNIPELLGHSKGQSATLNKTNEKNATAKVSKGEYFLTEDETKAVASYLNSQGKNIDQELAPTTDYPMNAAFGGLLPFENGGLFGRLRQALGRKTAEGFNQKDFRSSVHDYRGDNTDLYDPTDDTDVPSFKDWYQSESDYFNPGGGASGTEYSKRAFDQAGMNLGDVAAEYDSWMKENREDAYNQYTSNQSNTQSKNTTTGGITTGDQIIGEYDDMVKKFSNLYDLMTGLDVAKNIGLAAYNNEQTFKTHPAEQLSKGEYPIPSFIGQQNELKNVITSGKNEQTLNKTSDLSSNMAVRAANTAQGLSELRTGTNQLISAQEGAKEKAFIHDASIDAKNAELKEKSNQVDDYLTKDWLEKKGEAIGQSIENIGDDIAANVQTKKSMEEGKIGLQVAQNQMRTFGAGQAYTQLSTELGTFFPAEWLTQEGQGQFIDGYGTPDVMDKIAEARRKKAEADALAGTPPVTTVNPTE